MAAVQEAGAVFSVHFDGPITHEHLVNLRVMARTYEHMQRAIDRSYLIGKFGGVYKHARLKREDYAETEFLALYPRQGGIILDAVRSVGGGPIIDRIADAISAPFEQALQGGIDETATLRAQLSERRRYVQEIGVNDVQPLQDLIERPPPLWQQAYSNRSILKEVDQLTNQVASREVEGSSVELTLLGDNARSSFDFTSEIAKRFHGIVAAREVGPVVQVNAKIRELDRGNKYTRPRAKIHNLDSGREVVLHLNSDEDFHGLHPYHTSDSVSLLVSPYIEAGGFDLRGGDLIFIAVVG